MAALFTAYEFDSGTKGPHLLITAGVHGDEYEPMLAATRLANTIKPLLQKGRLTIVPLVNTSAFKRGSRCGEDGLDLARTCPGNPNGSSTERLAFEISQLIQKADYYIDLHTGGKLLDIFPLAGYMLHSSPRVLEQQQQMAQAFHLPVIWGTDPHAEGRTLSVARDCNIPSIYVEYGGGTVVGEHIITAYYEGCLSVLQWLGMISGEQPGASGTTYWLEDHRLNNGHLQSKTPAPAAGIFIPKVSLGTLVQKDASWGLIIDPVTGSETEVKTTGDGIVLFTRVAGYVQKGDALGGILPMTEAGKKIIDEGA